MSTNYNKTKYPFSKKFSGDGTSFSATSEAERWCRSKGFSVGSMCAGEPRMLLKSDVPLFLNKWRNLDPDYRENGIDGMMLSDDPRDGEVIVVLKKEPA